MTLTEVTLKPCGHCGEPLFIRNGPNAYGRCDTDGCWMHERAYTVPLGDQRQVDQWNKRASTDQSRVAVLEEAWNDLRRYIYDRTPERREHSIKRFQKRLAALNDTSHSEQAHD